MGSDDVSVLLGYGNGSFQKQTKYRIGSWVQSVVVADIDNDTCLDIVVANQNTNDVSVLLGYGNGTFQDQIRYLVGSASILSSCW